MGRADGHFFRATKTVERGRLGANKLYPLATCQTISRQKPQHNLVMSLLLIQVTVGLSKFTPLRELHGRRDSVSAHPQLSRTQPAALPTIIGNSSAQAAASFLREGTCAAALGRARVYARAATAWGRIRVLRGSVIP